MEKTTIVNEKIFFWLPIPAWLSWAILAMLLLAGHFLLAYLTRSQFYGIAITSEVCLLFLASIAPIYASKQLNALDPVYKLMIDKPENQIVDWIQKNTEQIFRTKHMLLSGLVLPVFLTPAAIIEFQAHTGNIILKIYDSLLSFTALFLCSMAFSIYPKILRRWYEFQSFPIKSVAIFFSWKGIKVISLTAAKFALIISTAYSLMIVFLLSGPTQLGIASYVYLVVGIIVCVTSFSIPQWYFHLILRKMKYQLLADFANEFHKAFEKYTHNASIEHIKTLEGLMEFYARLERLREWSFSWQSITSFLGSLTLLVIASAIKNLFLSKGH